MAETAGGRGTPAVLPSFRPATSGLKIHRPSFEMVSLYKKKRKIYKQNRLKIQQGTERNDDLATCSGCDPAFAPARLGSAPADRECRRKPVQKMDGWMDFAHPS